ncbi:LacI family transcriptional regulator [Rhodococcus sp. 06-156-3C]|uniref:LacI family DNA-binding transcriptional regulator n=1 Tax=Nocardiaceae TaxID=85025 RepID=UPI0005230135|nr:MULTISPECIES: LacI family DNA-binding transcriptional regulator [Rhodococcus]OZD07570.1 LacI family transcriptional regulator [Rhodococcus sp. 06-156-4C]OZD17222.1 LacI family transcriptional regulator [Rhodococcus sp. 06-156-3C]OZD18560.1 LacI family transcriptional regulator [Rhodococcus sp. 06-156-4a]OZD28240.1 LacI family transcriptional regulator [Rhodococcus sp. 06-156-3]OZD29991.1 LacI family transcriptional regulator [Rhodococcus sp. 06-156-3b]
MNAGRSVTMQDIADKVGVSKALVSMIFRGVPGPSAETKARVLAVAEEMDYRPNRTAALLSLRRTHLIGVMTDIRNAFHAEMVEHMVAEADKVGYEVVLGAVTPTHAEAAVMETLLDFRCEAVVLLGPAASDVDLRAWAGRVPIVAVGRRIGGVDAVRAGDSRGMSDVVDHLVSLGHNRIAHFSGYGSIGKDRQAGYRRAMHRHGLDEHMAVVEGDFTENYAPAAVDAFLDGDIEPPTAIVAANDRSAVGLLDALQRRGVSVPGDISVTGYDDSTLARMAHIDLTTVSQEPKEQARRAISAATSRLDDDRTEVSSSVLRPRLVVRGTTGPAERG